MTSTRAAIAVIKSLELDGKLIYMLMFKMYMFLNALHSAQEAIILT
ncbi:hypothetical protein GcC1_139024 [Golovinomyces cichoracearum]|uniref:Uncharacterized protein n=1 Tax=Golovinomyces cichoracearum TaxID=62708 RepID=A0A420I180_9PEZI|nr:hypothetical protein GcC1_139024 [Golovinomyces cichoracearum]